MIFIGVTGGIGSGKSTVCSLFEKKGTPVFYADVIAKEISEGIGLNEIVKEFGEQVLDSSKRLNRKKLAEIVFKDPQQLEKLNAIIHPKVFKSFNHWKQQNFPNAKFALVEAALMFESGMFELVHYNLAVVTDESMRIQRVSARDHSSEEDITVRMKNQISTEELLELSDFQIQNNGSLSDLTEKVNFFFTLFSTLTLPKEIA
ncbi:MAG: dephospho-CoA kinase [Bacteroidota bacterium]